MTSALTHLAANGDAHMVDVGAKAETQRGAIAQSQVLVSIEAFRAVRDNSGPKGDALAVARIAGVQAAKRTADLIPLCHPLRLSRIDVSAELDETQRLITFTTEVHAVDRTGVEMEALTAASVAALTLYDMIKAIDRTAEIVRIRLLRKWGGKSGDFRVDAP